MKVKLIVKSYYWECPYCKYKNTVELSDWSSIIDGKCKRCTVKVEFE